MDKTNAPEQPKEKSRLEQLAEAAPEADVVPIACGEDSFLMTSQGPLCVRVKK